MCVCVCVCVNVVAGVYPPPPSMAYPSSGPYVAPPPVGYPVKDAHPNPQNPPSGETKSRGDNSGKGWYVETGNLYIFLFDIQLVSLEGQNHTFYRSFSNKKNPTRILIFLNIWLRTWVISKNSLMFDVRIRKKKLYIFIFGMYYFELLKQI